MKTLCGLLFVVAACGGGAKSSKSPMATGGGGTTGLTECGIVAAHVADAVFTWAEPPPTKKENVVLVINEHCESDKWTADAKKCFGAITNEESAKPCVETLTKDQHDKVMNAMEATFDHKAHDAGTEGATRGVRPASSPPPAPPPPPPGKGGPAKGADPCEGGE